MVSFEEITESVDKNFKSRERSVTKFVTKGLNFLNEAFDKSRQLNVDLLDVDKMILKK